jgi:hypothetical protein
MEETEFQTRLRERLGLRVGPEMARYLLGRLNTGTLGAGSIPAMGTDARTGIPVLRDITSIELRAAANPDRPQTSL